MAGLLMDSKRISLKKAIMLFGMVFMLVMLICVVTVNYFVQRKLIYDRYEHDLGQMLQYVDSYIDKDDLYECYITLEESDQYRELQRFFDNFIDNNDIHYLYIMRPIEEDGHDRAISLMAANTMWEKENEPENLLDLGYTDDYDPDIVLQLADIMKGDDIVYFKDDTSWGSDYTAAMPVVNSAGEHYAVLCIDEDVTEINSALLRSVAANTLFSLGMVLIFVIILMRWLESFVIRPITSISEVISEADLVEDGDRFPVINALDELECSGSEVIKLRDTLVVFMLENHFYSTDLKYAKKEMIGMDRDMHTDVLTGLGNSRLFDEEASKINKRISEGFRDFSVIVIDINDLKRINDIYGHEKGDEFIKGCSKIISNSCKDAVICRTGGDEFVALFTGDNSSRRASFCEVRLNSEYYDSSHKDARPWEKYSASVGKATMEDDDREFKEVLKRADRRMYTAKLKYKEKNGSYR